MPQLTQPEINFIRETVSGHITTADKLKQYSNQCTDTKIKQMFQTASTQAEQSAQKLIDML